MITSSRAKVVQVELVRDNSGYKKGGGILRNFQKMHGKCTKGPSPHVQPHTSRKAYRHGGSANERCERQKGHHAVGL